MEFASITLGIVNARNTDQIIYSLNTIFGQKIKAIQLIVTVDEYTNISMGDVIDCVNIHNRDQKTQVLINYNRQNNGYFHNLRFILEQVSCEYLLLLFDGAAFYDDISLMGTINELRLPNKAIIANTVLYDAVSEQFKEVIVGKNIDIKSTGSLIFSEITKLSIIYQSKFFKSMAEELIEMYKFRPNCLEITFKGILERLFLANEIQSTEVNCLRCDTLTGVELEQNLFNNDDIKVDKKEVLNYTVSQSLYAIIDKLRKKSIPIGDVISEIDRKILIIKCRKNNSEWDFTDSDKCYIKYLIKIKKVSMEYEYYKRNFKLLGIKNRICRYANKKIKLVFFTMEYSVWPSFMSVYAFASRDIRFETQIVYLPFRHIDKIDEEEEEIQKYRNNGYEITDYKNYRIEKESPDIAFILKPYNSIPDKFYITQLEKVIKRCVYIPYGMEIGSSSDSIVYQCLGAVQFMAWKVVAYGPAYYKKMQEYTYNRAKNYITIGHPRIDLSNSRFYSFFRNKGLEKRILEKGVGKKIVLWNTHFTLSGKGGWGSFLEWGETILESAKRNIDILLIWRPHPLFYKAYANEKNIAVDDVLKWFYQLDGESNIVIDMEDSYLQSFHLSHAMISDAASFVPEYLCYKKPILYTPKRGSQGFLDKKMEANLMTVKTTDDICSFFERLVNGSQLKVLDPKDYLFLPNKKTVAEELLDYIFCQLYGEIINES